MFGQKNLRVGTFFRMVGERLMPVWFMGIDEYPVVLTEDDFMTRTPWRHR